MISFFLGKDSSQKVDIGDVGEAYELTVHTSDVRGAGTDANVFITLFGERSTSGRLQLKKSQTHKNKFERNQVSV